MDITFIKYIIHDDYFLYFIWADVLDEVGYEPVFKILEKIGLPRTFPDFTTATYTNGSVFNMARTLALAQRYLSADILVQMSLEPDPTSSRASLYVYIGFNNKFNNICSNP